MPLIISYTVIGLKVKRSKQLLDALDKLPPEDRRITIEQEMGSVPIPEKFTAEQWLKARIIHYKHIGLWIIACIIILLAGIVSWTYIENQKIKDKETAAELKKTTAKLESLSKKNGSNP